MEDTKFNYWPSVLDEVIGEGTHTTVFATSDKDVVWIRTNDFLKNEFLTTFEKVHNINLGLSEKAIINEETEENSFYMKKLYQKDFTKEELAEIMWVDGISTSSMYYDEMEKIARKEAKTKIGIAFADSLLAVDEFYGRYHHGYSILDFHSDQILFSETGDCYILDILE